LLQWHDAILLLAAIAVMKVGLVMYYYMHIYKLNENAGDDQHSLAYKVATSRLGLWLFLLSDSFVFGGLAVARFNLLGFTRPHLNQLLGLAVTSVLLLSSFFMNRAETSMAHGDRKVSGSAS
jgi:heme/copper-type cytochrome/quinol oxidase subunit 3